MKKCKLGMKKKNYYVAPELGRPYIIEIFGHINLDRVQLFDKYDIRKYSFGCL